MGARTLPPRGTALRVLSIDIVVTIRRIPPYQADSSLLISISVDAEWGNSLEINGCRKKLVENVILGLLLPSRIKRRFLSRDGAIDCALKKSKMHSRAE